MAFKQKDVVNYTHYTTLKWAFAKATETLAP